MFLIVAMASGAPRRGFDYRGVASGTRARDDGRIASETRARDDGATRQPRRQLLSTPGVLLNAIIQPTTFLRVALLILRNQLGNNPAQDFLQMVLTTDLGYTKFTNVFASFAAGVIQDFSSGVTSDAVLNQEWVIDGTSTLDNSVFSEFLYGGALNLSSSHHLLIATSRCRGHRAILWVGLRGIEQRCDGDSAELATER